MKTKHFAIPYRWYLLVVTVALGAVVGRAHAQATLAAAKKSPKPAPQALWVVDGTGNGTLPSISIFGGARLTKKTGTVASNGITTNPSAGAVEALAFDSQHNLWISLCTGESTPGFVIELSAAGLKTIASGGSAGPKIVIEDPSTTPSPQFLACPRGLAFDPSGNLWVEATGGLTPALLEYVADDLSSSTEKEVTPTPAVIQTGTVQTNFAPALAFDQAGNLWQSGGVITGQDQSVHQTVVEYTAAQLGAAEPQTTPNQTLIVADTSVPDALNAASAITFDSAGNLWVAFALGGTGGTGGVEMIAVGDFAGEGTSTPLPAITFGPATFKWGKVALQSFATPVGLAFDNQGDLWVANQAKDGAEPGTGSLVQITPSELTASGSPVPIRAILANKNSVNLGEPIYLTIGPVLP
jgi:hypothetical protein